MFGKNGFVWKQEVAFAKKLLVWQYERAGAVLPDEDVLSARAQNVVAEAHVIARKSKGTVLEILKQMIRDIKK
jgi:hypothetical protein